MITPPFKSIIKKEGVKKFAEWGPPQQGFSPGVMVYGRVFKEIDGERGGIVGVRGRFLLLFLQMNF